MCLFSRLRKNAASMPRVAACPAYPQYTSIDDQIESVRIQQSRLAIGWGEAGFRMIRTGSQIWNKGLHPSKVVNELSENRIVRHDNKLVARINYSFIKDLLNTRCYYHCKLEFCCRNSFGRHLYGWWSHWDPTLIRRWILSRNWYSARAFVLS